MKYRMIDIDNKESKGYSEIEMTHDFIFDGNVFYFGNIRSSRVRHITIDCDNVVIKTKNSTYTFIKINQ